MYSLASDCLSHIETHFCVQLGCYPLVLVERMELQTSCLLDPLRQWLVVEVDGESTSYCKKEKDRGHYYLHGWWPSLYQTRKRGLWRKQRRPTLWRDSKSFVEEREKTVCVELLEVVNQLATIDKMFGNARDSRIQNRARNFCVDEKTFDKMPLLHPLK